jgi:hypothetical protein
MFVQSNKIVAVTTKRHLSLKNHNIINIFPLLDAIYNVNIYGGVLMNSNNFKKDLIWFWLIGAITLIGLIIYISFQFKAELDTIPLIILAGSIGGFAHALYFHDNKIIYPRKGNDEQNNWFSLGFISDILLGAIAGLAGALPLKNDDPLQFIYVALISGFGGGAFLKSVQGKINSDNDSDTDASTISLNIPKEITLQKDQSTNAFVKLGSIELKDFTKEVTWSSSNEKIVSIDNGVIKAVDIGKADISATIPGDEILTAICKVTVY